MSDKIPLWLIWSEEMKKNSKSQNLIVDEPISLPDASAFNSKQLDLFQSFLCNNDKEREALSNTIEFWESIPKYSMTLQAQKNLRTKDGLLHSIERKTVYDGVPCTIRISPAQIPTKLGEMAFFPSANEELIEDVLRKMAADQQKGYFEQDGSYIEENFKSGVQFTLNSIREELKKHKRSRSHNEIVQSLLILSKSNIEINFDNGDRVASASYLTSLFIVNKDKIKQNADAKCFAQFHPLVTKSINRKTYRQYNYALMMSLSTQLGRWLYKKLAHNYKNASPLTTYDVWLSTIQRDSGLLDCDRQAENTRKLEDTLAELVEKDVLISAVRIKVEKGERNKINDIQYSLRPDDGFIKDVKAANKRQTKALGSE